MHYIPVALPFFLMLFFLFVFLIILIENRVDRLEVGFAVGDTISALIQNEVLSIIQFGHRNRKGLVEFLSRRSKNAFFLLRGFIRLSGIKMVRFKGCMKKRSIILCLYRLKDLPALCSLFNRETSLVATGSEPKVFTSILSLWKWINTTFQVLYIIVVGENSRRRIIGFIGLYNIKLGRSLYLSPVLFDHRDKGHGHGRDALELLMDFLQADAVVKEVYAEVPKTNAQSLHFFRGLGFEVCGQRADSFLLTFPASGSRLTG